MPIDPLFDPLKERLQRAVAPDYRVEHRIGEGGMGVVYRAHQLRLNRGVATAGQPREALRQLDRINVDSVAKRGDPFFRAIVHFQRAVWRARIGDIEGAIGELVWHEHLVGVPTGFPQAADVDWAFGTLASWRLARLLDSAGGAERGEACDAYAAVVRHWSDAPAPYGLRADTARTRAGEVHCGANR